MTSSYDKITHFLGMAFYIANPVHNWESKCDYFQGMYVNGYYGMLSAHSASIPPAMRLPSNCIHMHKISLPALTPSVTG